MKSETGAGPHHFPKDFFWGASTASHQVEGGTHNQWSVWELAGAAEHAKTARQRLDWMYSWDAIKEQAEDPENYISGRGVDHYKRYKEDFAIAKSMHLNAFRFGIEWSRIEPEEGRWNQEALDHYKQYIKEMRAQGLEPFINLWHWTNPVWFEEKGAFEKRKNLVYFDRFVQKVADELLDDINYVLTINESNTYTSFSYILGIMPPQGRNRVFTHLKVYYNLMLAHRRSYKILKKAKPRLQVGVAQNATANFPHSKRNLLEKIVARGSDYYWDTWFYARINKYQDFIGMNFYFVNYWKGFAIDNPKKPETTNDYGWYMEPARVYDVIMRLSKKFKKPVIVTENGVADGLDRYRQWWIEETIAAMDRALADGADLRGYLHWSLVDNFEWAEGWWPKFGLVEVDRKTMKRTMRPSAVWYGEQIKALRK